MVPERIAQPLFLADLRRQTLYIEYQNAMIFCRQSERMIQGMKPVSWRSGNPGIQMSEQKALRGDDVLLDDCAEIEAKIIAHFIKTFPDSQHVARVLAVSRYQGFVSPPDANNPQLTALMNRAKRFLGEEAVDRHVRTVQARLRQAARTLLREGTPEARKRTLEALPDVRAEMRMARQEDGYF